MTRAVVTYRMEAKVAPYLDALRDAGIEPVPATPAHTIESLNGMGLALTGGTDVDPALYGQERDARGDPPDRERDDFELRLLREALAADLPVIAICRGMQLFNIAHRGGTLTQHMEGHKLANHASHEVEIYPGSKLARILGAGLIGVNSRHHQAVADVGEGLIVSARSPEDVAGGRTLVRAGLESRSGGSEAEACLSLTGRLNPALGGVVEGLECPDLRFALAVQWHPEDMLANFPVQRKLFSAFRQALER
jgi:gamma-glutamyl-gamma-aminobutyrate hydrolase PuuD